MQQRHWRETLRIEWKITINQQYQQCKRRFAMQASEFQYWLLNTYVCPILNWNKLPEMFIQLCDYAWGPCQGRSQEIKVIQLHFNWTQNKIIGMGLKFNSFKPCHTVFSICVDRETWTSHKFQRFAKNGSWNLLQMIWFWISTCWHWVSLALTTCAQDICAPAHASKFWY